MKKTLKIFALVAMASAMAFSACTKDDEPNYSYNDNTGNNNGNGNNNGGGTQQQPYASFLVTNSFAISTNQSVSFTNYSSNATSYRWSFGDGSSSTLSNPTHTYTTVGDKTVTLTAYNGSYSDSDSKTIHVHASRVYITRIVLADWPSRNTSGNVWDQFATASTKHPDIFFKIQQGGMDVFTSEVIDDCIHYSDGGSTYPSFTVGQYIVAMNSTITFYDEDTLENVEMGSTSFNLYTLGANEDYPSVLYIDGGGFSIRIYLTWS